MQHALGKNDLASQVRGKVGSIEVLSVDGDPDVGCRLNVLQEIREAHLHAEGDDFEHRQRDRLSPALHIADEAAIDSEVGGHAKLRHIALAAQFAETGSEAAAYIDRKKKGAWSVGGGVCGSVGRGGSWSLLQRGRSLPVGAGRGLKRMRGGRALHAMRGWKSSVE